MGKEHKNAVNDQKHGIGSVTYWTAEVTLHDVRAGCKELTASLLAGMLGC